jgi:peptide/nickel transport system permease protein
MLNYIIRRLLLLPLTLFCIVLVNFVIINLAPGDPVTITEVSQEGIASQRDDRTVAFGSDERYLQFREHYGLTLPILFNTWPWTTQEQVDKTLGILLTKRARPEDQEEMYLKDYDALRTTFGDKSRYIMPKLLAIIRDPIKSMALRGLASRFFMRGGSRQAILGPNISSESREYNKKTAADNRMLRELVILPSDSSEVAADKVTKMESWYQANKAIYTFEPDSKQKIGIFFFRDAFVEIFG